MNDNMFQMNNEVNNLAYEAYEALKTNLLLYEFGRKIKTFCVTSYRAGEGKTTTSVNLAITLAKSGMKVLFVDADLRKSELMKTIKSTNLKGFSNYLLGHSSLEEVINITNITGLSYISCGVKPLNPVSLLGSSQFVHFLEKVREMYDLVILDTPPLGSVTDANIIASRTDGALLIIQQRKVELRNALIMIEQLKKSNANLLGVVLNKMAKSDYRSYFKEYDYYGTKRMYSKEWLKKLKKRSRFGRHGNIPDRR